MVGTVKALSARAIVISANADLRQHKVDLRKYLTLNHSIELHFHPMGNFD